MCLSVLGSFTNLVHCVIKLITSIIETTIVKRETIYYGVIDFRPYTFLLVQSPPRSPRTSIVDKVSLRPRVGTGVSQLRMLPTFTFCLVWYKVTTCLSNHLSLNNSGGLHESY